MIKVIFVDLKDGETSTIDEYRETLKNEPMRRSMFTQSINHMICHYLHKLREEKKEQDKCRKQSKQ